MFNENGVAYAPWMSKGIDEDAIVDDLMRKEKADKVRTSATMRKL